MNRKLIALAALFLAAGAQAQGLNHYPLIARVNAVEFARSTAPSNAYTTELQIVDTIFTSEDVCKAAAVGQSYPAQLTDRGIKLRVAGGSVCSFRIVGVREVGRGLVRRGCMARGQGEWSGCGEN